MRRKLKTAKLLVKFGGLKKSVKTPHEEQQYKQTCNMCFFVQKRKKKNNKMSVLYDDV